jgi:hypothetical protein
LDGKIEKCVETAEGKREDYFRAFGVLKTKKVGEVTVRVSLKGVFGLQ